MSPILDRIVRTDCGARKRTSQETSSKELDKRAGSWTSELVAGQDPGIRELDEWTGSWAKLPRSSISWNGAANLK
ncbi:hypothetical protein DY000_02014795 [Brassica cretica]|uniref:Uncharacterized protein n=1 Tax=Brassica cretica TaxID=69181 RepID=A0ABQ7D371_BRACR|nr:hypothetical protein DY000_02014795 [Brassica cretica]